MTVIDLDPPQPASSHRSLRLVATNPAPRRSDVRRDHRYRTSARLFGPARSLYCQVLQASLAHNMSVDPDALRVVLATKQATSAAPARTFSAAGIWQLMFVDVVAWCRNRQLDVPPGCAAALTTMIQVLEATNAFDELSDPPEALYDAIDECTGGWADEIS